MRTTGMPPAAATTTTTRLPHVGMLLHIHPLKEHEASNGPMSTTVPTARLPVAKMSNSDRAKFYRRQHKERTGQLVQSVALLRRDVQQLALHAQVLRALVGCGVAGLARNRIQRHMNAFFAAPRVRLPGFKTEMVVPTDVTAYGSAQATVVHTRLEITGKYPPASLEVVYCSFPGNSVLLDTLMHTRVRYRCVVRLFFARDGACEARTVGVDWVAGLTECVGRMVDVAQVVGPFQRLGQPCVDV